MAEIERRMKAAMDTSDPEAMLKAWMPLQGFGQGFEQFQQFMWDAARARRVAREDTPNAKAYARFRTENRAHFLEPLMDTIFALSTAPGTRRAWRWCASRGRWRGIRLSG